MESSNLPYLQGHRDDSRSENLRALRGTPEDLDDEVRQYDAWRDVIIETNDRRRGPRSRPVVKNGTVMDLKVGARNRVIHVPGCPRLGSFVTWGYGERYITDLEELSEHTEAFPQAHCCPYCLPDVCRCEKCLPSAGEMPAASG